jgi:hypothetical protein
MISLAGSTTWAVLAGQRKMNTSINHFHVFLASCDSWAVLAAQRKTLKSIKRFHVFLFLDPWFSVPLKGTVAGLAVGIG